MKEIKIAKESINKVNYIISNMNGKTFHNHYHILYDICSSLEKNNLTYLEIGAYGGGSASLVSLHESVSKVYSIDIGQPIKKEIPINNVNKFKHHNCSYEYIEGDSKSQNIINYVHENVKNIDVFFIDGDHTYNAVIQDFNNYKELVVSGGYIVFDDYRDSTHSPDVFHAVNKIVEEINKDEFDIIGTLNYDLLSETNQPNLGGSNEFILRKK
jgi:cephalosporin hydroxylase